LLITERRLRKWHVVRVRKRRVILHTRRRVVPILDSDRRSVVETGSGTGFVGEASRRRWDYKRWEHRL
jgi:hypothetical protein